MRLRAHVTDAGACEDAGARMLGPARMLMLGADMLALTITVRELCATQAQW